MCIVAHVKPLNKMGAKLQSRAMWVLWHWDLGDLPVAGQSGPDCCNWQAGTRFGAVAEWR